MSDLVPSASPLFLREDEVRRGIELLYFGYSDLVRGADERLTREALGRAHHRALYFIARRPGISVSALVRLLGITKQSLRRVLTELQGRGFVEQTTGTTDRRQRLLSLTDAGLALEYELFMMLRERMAQAYASAGQEAVSGYWRVLAYLLRDDQRQIILHSPEPRRARR